MNILKSILLVGIGGGTGSILRYLTAIFVNRFWANAFPMATFTINLLGCLVIGILAGVAEKQAWFSDNYKLLFITGFCGGYTTFSAFAIENVTLVQGNNSLLAFLYIGLSVLAGMAAVWLGMALVK